MAGDITYNGYNSTPYCPCSETGMYGPHSGILTKIIQKGKEGVIQATFWACAAHLQYYDNPKSFGMHEPTETFDPNTGMYSGSFTATVFADPTVTTTPGTVTMTTPNFTYAQLAAKPPDWLINSAVPLADKYKNAWGTVSMEQVEKKLAASLSLDVASDIEPEETVVPAYKKFDSANDHMVARKLNCYCEAKNVTGQDHSLKHWGNMYSIADSPYLVCSNHLLNNTVVKKHLPAVAAKKVCSVCNKAVPITHEMKQKGYGQPWQYKVCTPCMEKYKGNYSFQIRIIGSKEDGITHKTQKARGIRALANYGFEVPEFSVIAAKDEIKADVEAKIIGSFIRPCPMRPRHGFVDSRVVKSTTALEKLRKETLAADPDAEFVIMPFIKAAYSGIWTDGSLAIGVGHDGATGGTSAITLPIAGDYLATVNNRSEAVKKMAAIKDAPYVELLWGIRGKDTYYDDGLYCPTYNTKPVQLRDGPKLPQGQVDYIPEATEVKEIIVAKGDLLRWEEMMRHCSPGTIVYHPNGSLASHYSIHAVLNKVPVLISREPVIGEIVAPTSGDADRVPNLNDIKNGFLFSLTSTMNFKDATYLMLAGLHHVVLWRGRYDALLGAAMGAAYRLALIASAGECRHLTRPRANRDAVYKAEWGGANTEKGTKLYVNCLDKFLNHHWPSSGYGGIAWYSFAVLGAQMYNAIVDGEIDKAFEFFNKLVHSAHNGGWAFNKFMQQEEMSEAARNPVFAAVQVAPYLYEVVKTFALLRQGELFDPKQGWVKIETYEETKRGKAAWRNSVDANGKLVEKNNGKMCKGCLELISDCSCSEGGDDGDGDDSVDGCDCSDCMTLKKDYAKGLAQANKISNAINEVIAKAAKPAVPKTKMPVKSAQAYLRHGKNGNNTIHVQYKTEWYEKNGNPDNQYGKKDYPTTEGVPGAINAKAFLKAYEKAVKTVSMAGSGQEYGELSTLADGWYMGDIKLLEVEEK